MHKNHANVAALVCELKMLCLIKYYGVVNRSVFVHYLRIIGQYIATLGQNQSSLIYSLLNDHKSRTFVRNVLQVRISFSNVLQTKMCARNVLQSYMFPLVIKI